MQGGWVRCRLMYGSSSSSEWMNVVDDECRRDVIPPLTRWRQIQLSVYANRRRGEEFRGNFTAYIRSMVCPSARNHS